MLKLFVLYITLTKQNIMFLKPKTVPQQTTLSLKPLTPLRLLEKEFGLLLTTP